MKKFFNTVAVFLANLLAMKPTSWKESAKQAEEMQTAFDAFTPSTVMIEGKEEEVAAPDTPFVFLCSQILNAFAFVTGVYIIYKIVSGFMALLPFILGAVVVVCLSLYLFGNKKPSAPPAAATAS